MNLPLSLILLKKRLLAITILSLSILLSSNTCFGWSFGTKLVPEYWNDNATLVSTPAHALTTIPPLSAFKSLHGLDPNLLQKALKGYAFAKQHSKVKKPYLAIVDYAINSNKPRLWIFNLETHQLVANLRVTHGANSGAYNATHFSNKMYSHKSCLGVFVTGQTYYGHFGYSLYLYGLQKGINDNTYSRHIVIHPGQGYVDDKSVKKHGEAAKTWGCLALNPKYAQAVVNLLKGGSVINSFRG